MKNQKFRKKLITVLCLLIWAVPFSVFAKAPQFGFNLGIENFRWKEFDNGAKLLEESGNRFTIGGHIGNDHISKKGASFIYDVEGKIYLGTVGYDGQTQSGLPVKTETQYTGLLIEAITGLRFGFAEHMGLDLFAGLGFDTWRRDLKNTTLADGTQVSGAEELYLISNFKLGVGPYVQTSKWKGQFRLGIKLPFSTNEYIDSSSSGFVDDVNLSPEGRSSLFVNINNTIKINDRKVLFVRVYYDSYRFDRSDSELVSDGSTLFLVWQPKSEQDIYGLQVGLSF